MHSSVPKGPATLATRLIIAHRINGLRQYCQSRSVDCMGSFLAVIHEVFRHLTQTEWPATVNSDMTVASNTTDNPMTLTPLTDAPFVIQIHTALALGAMILTVALFSLRRGSPLHRMLGWTWVIMMAVVALSSFWIYELRLIGPFSPIHMLSLIRLWTLFQRCVQRADIRVANAPTPMKRLVVGALLVAGAFTFLPGRMMHRGSFRRLGPSGSAKTVGAAAGGHRIGQQASNGHRPNTTRHRRDRAGARGTACEMHIADQLGLALAFFGRPDG